MANPADIGNSSENRKTAIDWAAKPAPWCWIGPQFARECQGIRDGSTFYSEAATRAVSIRQRRIVLRLTQKRLAALAGLSYETIGDIERRRSNGYPRTITKILTALDRLEAERDAS